MKNILKFLLVLLIMWPVYAQSQEPAPSPIIGSQQPQDEAAIVKQKAYNDKRGSEDSPLFVNVLKTEDDKDKAKREEKSKNEQAATERLLANYTLTLAIITAFLVIITGFLARFTYKLWASTSDTAKRQLRAYVFVSVADQGSFFNDEHTGCLSIPLIIKNYGQTPAHRVKCSAFMGRYKLPLAEILDEADYTNGSLGCIAPTQIFRQYPKLPRKLSPVEKADIRNGICGIYVWGYLEYIDVFKELQTVQFRMLSTGDDFNRGELAYCQEGNEAT